MQFLVRLIKGLIIGVASVTAGAGTFAIVLGIYDRCMEIIAKPFKNFKENLIFIFPIVLGILISVSLLSNVVEFLMENYTSYVKCAFIGIIIGGIPQLLRVANKKGKNKKYGLSLLVAMGITILLTFLGNRLISNGTVKIENIPAIQLVIYGMIYAFGAVMPGMTTVHILVFLGVFQTIYTGILSLNWQIIVPFGIGYITVVILTANLISYLFKRYYGYTYYAIIGFSIMSLTALIPEFKTWTEFLICLLLIIILSYGMYKITRLETMFKNKSVKNLE